MTLPIALIAIFLINSFDPYNEMLSAVRLVGNYIEVGEEVSVSTKQTCPVGIWNTSTHLLEENPNCTASRELLKMPRVETKKKITLLLLYYNDHKHLAHQVVSWKNFSQAAVDQTQFVIVDDGSTLNHTAADCFAANKEMVDDLDVIIYKIDQDLAWNIGGARNLGFWMSNTEWIFMNDADIIVKSDTMDFVSELANKDYSNFDGTNKAPVYLYFKRWRASGFKKHPAVMLLKREHYWKVGGCDEDFVGNYGQTDPHFRLKVKLHPHLRHIATEDLMNEKNISPLYEMADDLACPIGMTCLEPYVGQAPSRDTRPNRDMLTEKRNAGMKWSNKCLRFTWKRVTWGSSWAWFGWF